MWTNQLLATAAIFLTLSALAADPPRVIGPIVGVGRGEPLTPAQEAAERAKEIDGLLAQFTGADEAASAFARDQLARMGKPALPAVEKAATGAAAETKPRFDALLNAMRADAKARAAVEKFVKAIPGAEHGELAPIVDDALQRAFKDTTFYTLRFRQFPVARMVPEGMKPSNVLASGADEKVQELKDPDALRAFFKTNLAAVTDEAAARDAARAWLRITQEWRQDGFYRFAIPADGIAVEKAAGGVTVNARTVVTGGGNQGEVSTKMTFDPAGKLASATDAGRVREGVRPICQATKLLDPDPIVRGMAEQSIRVMGLAARDYLIEQRAKASPELRVAIDAAWARVVEEGR